MRTFILKIIFLIRISTKIYWRKIQPNQIYKRYPYWMILWKRKHCWFTNDYHDWSSNGKVSKNIFAGYGSIITTLEGTGRCSKRVFWSCWGTWGHICYIDRTEHTSVEPSITINLVCTSLKHPENMAERSPLKTLLKEKTALLQEDEGHIFGKKFRSHIIEIEIA